jgi:hypothetical protein
VSSDVLPIILGIGLVAMAAAFVLLPFARGPRVESVAPSDNPTADRMRLYRQVLELEFDRDMGKLSQTDFEQLSTQLLAEAGAALRQEHGAMSEVDAEIEREIAAARAAFAAARQSTREMNAETPVL